MDDFEGALPREIVNRATRSGDELVLALEDARDAIRIADQNLIAVLGVEVFRFLYGGLGVEAFSGYEFKFDASWQDFAVLNNKAALRFLDENGFSQGDGYILTTASEDELGQLQNASRKP
jgi:hypothetical protein